MLDRAAMLLGWHEQDRGALGNIIRPGEKVVVKPNLVLHANQGPCEDRTTRHAPVVDQGRGSRSPQGRRG